jgi:hypothetical protein
MGVGDPGPVARRPTVRRRAIRLLAVLAALFAAVPGIGVSPASAEEEPERLKVVLLGDSYSAGNGAGSYYGPRGCYRSRRNWAERYLDTLRAADWKVMFVNRACSGATTSDVLNPRLMRAYIASWFLDGEWAANDPALPERLLEDRS